MSFVKDGGKLILIEGFLDGFDALNEIRKDSKIEAMRPASINFYSPKDEFFQLFPSNILVKDTFHTGMFDFLTRVIYPALVGSKNASEASEFHHKISNIVRTYNPETMRKLARLHGWVLVKS